MTYEYKCDSCGTVFEINATVAEKARGLRPECPICASPEATQVYSSMALFSRSRSGGGTPPCCGPGSGSGRC
jgi:putative FmdB family regulatory protein